MFKTTNVTILVSDMTRSIKFYTEALGLKLISNYGGEFAVIESNGLRIGLHPGNKPAEKPGRNMSLGFQVDDAVAAKKNIGIAGRNVRKPCSGPWLDYRKFLRSGWHAALPHRIKVGPVA